MLRQRKRHKNEIIFKLLVNKAPLKRICEVVGISPQTVYDKINFLHHQCLAFVADRERMLAGEFRRRRLYISVDSQQYMVNWSQRIDKRNVRLAAVASADNNTSYVFGVHVNFDDSLDGEQVEKDAIASGDYALTYPFRKYARVWLKRDYEEAAKRGLQRRRRAISLESDISEAYAESLGREDIEISEELDDTLRLPSNGMQVHSEYTLYAHFELLRTLFAGIEKVRFFLDQDSGMRAACLAAFRREIKERTVDAFYVRIAKGKTIGEKRRLVGVARKRFREEREQFSILSESQVKLRLIKQQLANMKEHGKWRDRWLVHPFPNMSEPEKSVCYLTDMGDYDQDHLAWLYNKATLHGVDRFLMQIRRRISMLERPIPSASSGRRVWHGYSPYNPAVITKLLDIFRVYYDYILEGKDKRTPAQRLGLADESVTIEDVCLYGAP